jgi:pSer/pThr/pTyr-binding forkhead associated (FHA) protein
VALDGGPDIPLDRTPIVVGRDPYCEARLNSMRVSRRHCFIHVVDSQVEVRDLGSTNGIFINGLQSPSGRLRPGDVLTIAHLRYRLDTVTPNRKAGRSGDVRLN